MTAKNISAIGLILSIGILIVCSVLPVGSQAPRNQCVDFNRLTTGEIVGAQFGNALITSQYPDAHPPMIFDSGKPTGGDYDLGTPSNMHGGPGRGEGGASNSVPLGNLLILSEDGDQSDPDDKGDPSPAYIDFAFSVPFMITVVHVVDIEPLGSSLVVTDSNGAATSVDLPKVGDNGVAAIGVNIDDVAQMRLTLSTSGGITFVACPAAIDDPTATSTATVLATITATSTAASEPASSPTPQPAETSTGEPAYDSDVIVDDQGDKPTPISTAAVEPTATPTTEQTQGFDTDEPTATPPAIATDEAVCPDGVVVEVESNTIRETSNLCYASPDAVGTNQWIGWIVTDGVEYDNGFNPESWEHTICIIPTKSACSISLDDKRLPSTSLGEDGEPLPIRFLYIPLIQ